MFLYCYLFHLLFALVALQGDATGRHLYQGDIMLDATPNQTLHEMGRKAEEGAFGVIIWPLRVWRTREVPYTIKGHAPRAIRKWKIALTALAQDFIFTISSILCRTHDSFQYELAFNYISAKPSGKSAFLFHLLMF